MPTLETVLRSVAPKADPAFLAATAAIDVVEIMKSFGFTGRNEQAQLIGHMAVECGGFRVFAENLNYSAERLTQVWPKRYPSIAAAQPYAHNPKALAINVYGSRGGNRPGTTDGWDYRGSGGLQHTFLPEFDRVQKRTGLPVVAKPDMLRDKTQAKAIWMAACSYFVDRGALAPAKAGDTLTTTKKINGGVNGLADRKILIARADKAIGAGLTSTGVAELPKVEVPAGPMTTTEVADDEKKKRDVAIGTGTAGTAGSGPVSTGGKVPNKGADWVMIGGVVIAVALFSFFIVRIFWRRHAQAQADVERLQLASIQMKSGE